MQRIFDLIIYACDRAADLIWGTPSLWLLCGTGILMTVRTGAFHIKYIRHWFSSTLGGIFRRDGGIRRTDDSSVSQLGAVCTTLAATVGVGSIAGVSVAIAVGGAGALFWMWIAALIGMATAFSENILGVLYRRKNEKGETVGGPMYYLRDGLRKRRFFRRLGDVPAVLFSLFCVGASFGIGNICQVNAIEANAAAVFPFLGIKSVKIGGVCLSEYVLGVGVALCAGAVILGGVGRLSAVTERLVPIMVVGYVLGAAVIIFMNAKNILPAFAAVFRGAFGLRAATGGAAGTLTATVSVGMRRGVFASEAGLGSSVIVNSASNVEEPVKQGMWGIFEVFVNTAVICTVTALVILTSGIIDLNSGALIDGAVPETLVSYAFSLRFGKAGSAFIALAVLLFAFSTLLGWSYYGEKACEFLFDCGFARAYKILFVLLIPTGALMNVGLAFALSDVLNGLMMLPNLLGIIVLSGEVSGVTKNYVNRKLKPKREKSVRKK